MTGKRAAALARAQIKAIGVDWREGVGHRLYKKLKNNLKKQS